MELTSPLAGKGDAEQEEGGGKWVAKQLVALQLLLQPSLCCLFPALIKKQESKSLSYPEGDVTRDALLVATALGFIQHTSHWTSPKASYSKTFLYKQLIRETRKLWEKKTAAGTVLWPLCRISGCSTVKYYSSIFLLSFSLQQYCLLLPSLAVTHRRFKGTTHSISLWSPTPFVACWDTRECRDAQGKPGATLQKWG